MAYIYPLTLDPLNLTGKHDDDDVVVPMLSTKNLASPFSACQLDLSPMQVRMLVVSVDFYINSLKEMSDSAPTDLHKILIEDSISCFLDIRDVLKNNLGEV